MRPTITFRWSFTMRQSGRMRRSSASPSVASASTSTPGASQARSPPRTSGATSVAAAASASASTPHLVEQRLDPVEVRGPRKRLRARAGGPREDVVAGAERAAEGAGQRVKVVRALDDERRERTVEELRRARLPARHDRDTRRARLEDDVAERLLAGRDAHHVRGREHRLDVAPRSGDDDAPAETVRLAPPAGEALVVADQDEDGVARRPLAPEPEEEIEALPREAAPDRRADARPVRDAERAPRRGTEGVAPRGMEALEVDPVVDDRDPLAGDRVVGGNLGPGARRDREHVPVTGRRERRRFEAEDRTMVRSAAAGPKTLRFHPSEIAPVRAAPDADHVLPRRPPEADDDIPALARDRTRGEPAEGDDAGQPARAQDRNATDADAGERRVGARAEDVQLVAARREALRHPAEVRLGAAAGEPAVHEGDAHQSGFRLARSASQRARRR